MKKELWGFIRSATIQLFNSALQNDVNEIKVSDGTAIEKALVHIDYANALIFVNGYPQDKSYILKENDVCTIRVFPSAVATGIVALTAVVGGAWYLGESIATGQWDIREHCLWKWLKSGSTEDASLNGQSSTETVPCVSGASNTSGKNQPVPIILGQTLFTPSFGANSYKTISGIDGEDEIYHGLYTLGFNGLDVKKVSMGIFDLSTDEHNGTSGDLTVLTKTQGAHYDPSKYGQKLEIRQDGNEVSLFPQKVVQEDFNSELLYPPQPKGVSEPVTPAFFLPVSARYPQKIEVEFKLSNLLKYDDNGNEGNTEIDIACAYSLDGGATYHAFPKNIGYGQERSSDIKIIASEVAYDGTNTCKLNRIIGCKNKVMRFVAPLELPYSDVKNAKNNVIEMKIWRYSQKIDDSRIQGTPYLSSVRTWCYDYEKSKTANDYVIQRPFESKYTNMIARLGFEIKAGDEVTSIGKINVVEQAIAPVVVNGSFKKADGSFNIAPTCNPASMALMLMKHVSRGEYVYPDSMIDYDSFVELYNYCEVIDNSLDTFGKKRYVCNGAISSRYKTIDLLNNVLATANSRLILIGTKYGIWCDKPQTATGEVYDASGNELETTPIMVVNNQHILSASNQKNFEEEIDGFSATFIDSLNDYQQTTIVCVDNNAKQKKAENPDYEYKLEKIELLYTTDAKRVHRRCMRKLAERRLRPETWNRKEGIEANLIELGNLVTIQDDTIAVGIGDGAEIKSLIFNDDNTEILGIVTDGKFNVTNASERYGVKITCGTALEDRVLKREVEISAVGEHSAFMFVQPIYIDETVQPAVGDTLSFGIFTKISTDSLCLNKKDNGDGTFEMSYVPYQNGIYTAELGDIPEYVSNVTKAKQSGLAVSDETPKATLADVMQAKSDLTKQIEKLTTSVQVYVYKRSATALTRSDLPTENATYLFNTDSLIWDSTSSESNGWTRNIPSGENQLYVSMATAYSQDLQDTIEPSDWSTPVETDKQMTGVNTATVTLYKRSSETPSKPTEVIAYQFSNGKVTGNLDGWSQNVQETDGNPLYAIVASAISTSNVDSISADEWTDPIIVNRDGVSPTATITKSGKVATITITDKDGTTTETISDGEKGDGYWYNSTVDLSDTSVYNSNTWYPVVGTALPNNGATELKVSVQLNSGTKPSWSTHNQGFSVDFHVQDQRSGWGTTSAVCLKYLDTFNWTQAVTDVANQSPVSYTQMTNSSLPVFYLRGGGKYFVFTSYSSSWSIKTSTFTSSSQSVSPSVAVRPTPRGTYIQGSNGSRGGEYRGVSTSAVSNPVKDDYYLNSSTTSGTGGYIFVYNGSSWDKVESYSDYRYQVAMADMVKLSATASTCIGNVGNATSTWVQNLMAGTALVNCMFACSIKIGCEIYGGTRYQGGGFCGFNCNGFVLKSDGSIYGHIMSECCGHLLIGSCSGNNLYTSGYSGCDTFIGHCSGFCVTNGNYNTALGAYSLGFANTSGSVAIGFNSGYCASGNSNVSIGNYSNYKASGCSNIAIGYCAGYDITTGSCNIVIGDNAKVACADGSGQLNIGGIIYTGYNSYAANVKYLCTPMNTCIGSNLSVTNDIYGCCINGTTKVYSPYLCATTALCAQVTDNTCSGVKRIGHTIQCISRCTACCGTGIKFTNGIIMNFFNSCTEYTKYTFPISFTCNDYAIIGAGFVINGVARQWIEYRCLSCMKFGADVKISATNGVLFIGR